MMGSMAASGDVLPDEALLAGFGAGDGALAVAFVRRFQRIVFGVAVAVTSDPGTAEDVAQHAFEQAWRHASVYDARRGSVRSWLTTITHNLAVDVVRARSALPMDPDDLPAVLTAMTDSPERVAVANDSAEGLRLALGRLPATQARAVAMAGIYGMTALQVAEAEDKVPGLLGIFEPDAPGMHQTVSLDYVIVLEGDLWIELDDGAEVHLPTGTCLIQNGADGATPFQFPKGFSCPS